MSFSQTGSVITQTGTDGNLAGLSGLTGVTTQVSGTGSAQHTTYYVDSTTSLQVDGSIDIAADSEKLSLAHPYGNSSNQIPLTINGSVTVDGTNTQNGRTSYSRMVAIDATSPSGVWWRDNSILINSGGTFTLNGGAIRIGSGVSNSGQLTLKNCLIYAMASSTGIVIRSGSNPLYRNVEINGELNSPVYISASSGFSEATITLNNAFYYTETAQGTDINFIDYDIANNISSYDINFENQTQMCVVNFYNTNNRMRVRQQNANRGGYGKCFKEFNVPVEDLNGTALEFSYYGKDFNNGSRMVSFLNAYDDTADKIYSGINQTGNFTDSILWEILIPKNSVKTSDDRTNANDKIPINFIGYGQSITPYTPTLISLSEETNPIKMSPDLLITVSNKSTVDAYTTLETPTKFYDRAKSYLVTNYAGELSTLVSRSGNQIDAGAYNVTIDATAPSAFDLTGNLITIKASTFTGDMVTTGLITLANGAIFDGVRTDANGTVYPDQPISITNISAGSRMRIYNVTTGVETVNTVVSGTSYTSSYQEGTGYNDGDTVRVYLTKLGKEEWVGDVIDTSNGFSVLAAQDDDDVYTALGIDGTTVTKFQADYVNNEVDLVIGADWTMAELYAWWANNLTTEDGIRNFFGGITAIDQANFRINTSIVDLYLDNTTNASYKQTDNRRFFRDTGTGYPVRNPTTSGYGLDVVWRNTILIAQTEAGGTSDLNFYDVKRAVKQVITNPKYIKGQK